MNINLFYSSLNVVSAVGTPLIFLSALTSAALFICCVFSNFRKTANFLSYLLFTELISCFLLLLFFHFRVFQAIKVESVQGIVSAALPPWIEGEKLFVWALLIQFVTILNRKRLEPVVYALLAINSLFIIFIAIFSNPFNPLLPGFQNEINELSSGISSGNLNTAFAAKEQIAGKIRYFYNSTYMWLHPPLLFLSYSVFGISFVSSIYMLINKGKKIFEEIAYNFGKFGYLMLTIGMLLGYPWAVTAWKDEPWWWSPKINMSIMTWLFYTAYLHSRLFLKKNGMWNTTAILGIVAFIILILTYITTYTIPGTHSYG